LKSFFARNAGRLLPRPSIETLPACIGCGHAPALPSLADTGRRLPLLGRGHLKQPPPPRLAASACVEVLSGPQVRVMPGGHGCLGVAQLGNGPTQLLTAMIGENQNPHPTASPMRNFATHITRSNGLTTFGFFRSGGAS
jgi:hypothetical protein